MNYTTAIFLINSTTRAILATYEAEDNAKRTLFKTLDPTIKVDDFVLVQTDTRHKMTVCKVMEVDVDFDLESNTPVSWVIGKVDRAHVDSLMQQEADAVKAIKAAELRKKRNDLKESLLANYAAEINSLPIANVGGVLPAPEGEKAA